MDHRNHPPHPEPGLSLLIVDPDRLARLAFAAHATASGLPLRVLEASSLEEAREQIARERLDVVAAEYQLGDGTAFELLQCAAPAPVIVVTNQGSEQEAVSLMKAGAIDYLVKDSQGKYLPHLAAAAMQVQAQRERQSLFHMLTHALMCIHDSVFITDMHDVIMYVNQAFIVAYGYEEKEIVGRHVATLFNGDGLPSDMLKANFMGWSGEVFHTRRDGRRFPVSLSRSVVLDGTGRRLAVVGVARDITARRQAEEQVRASLKEKEVLLREIHHRVKNNLQVVSSLLNLQTGYIQDDRVADALRDSQNRVKSMALIHERLYQSRILTRIDFKDYLESLIGHVKSSYRGVGDVRVSTDIQQVFLNVDEAIPCGLMVNELVSNALKHAFPEDLQGELKVSLRVEEADAERQTLVLEVGDNGAGFPPDVDFERTQSLGLQLVSMLARQIRGELELIRSPGTLIRLRFSVST